MAREKEKKEGPTQGRKRKEVKKKGKSREAGWAKDGPRSFILAREEGGEEKEGDARERKGKERWTLLPG